MTYAEWQAELTYTVLLNPQGNSYSRAVGIIKDYYTLRAKLGVNLRFPFWDDADQPNAADALGALGQERLVEQGNDTTTGVTESRTFYASRLQKAWGHDGIRGHAPDTFHSVWYWGGTALGMLKAFGNLGYRPTIIQQNGLYWSRDMSNNLVVVDNPPLTGWPYWNSFLVLFPTTPPSWTSPAVPATSGSIPDENEINRLIRLVNLWKPAHMKCLGIQINVSGRVWGYPPAGSGGAPVWGTGTWGGSILRWPVPEGPPVNL